MAECVSLQAVEVPGPVQRFPHKSASGPTSRFRRVPGDGRLDRCMPRQIAPPHHCDHVEHQQHRRTKPAREHQGLGNSHVGMQPCLQEPTVNERKDNCEQRNRCGQDRPFHQLVYMNLQQQEERHHEAQGRPDQDAQPLPGQQRVQPSLAPE